MHTPVNADARVYALALALSVLSALLFGSVPIRQVFRTDPYQVIKMGPNTRVGRHFTARDILVAVQIAICAVLVTSSLVALRGLARAMHSDFGFQPRNSVLVAADLSTAGYHGAEIAPMQKRMLDALSNLHGVESVGLTNALLLNDQSTRTVFKDATADLRPSNAAASVYTYHVSPDYLRAEGTTLLSGRTFTPHDDSNSPHIAVVNAEFARRMFGSLQNAIGAYYKLSDGTRIQIVGVTENGKYGKLTEEATPAMFLPILQWPSNSGWIVVRSSGNPQKLLPAIRNTLHQLDPALPVVLETRLDEIGGALFPSQLATVALGVLGVMGAMLSIAGIFATAAYSVTRRLKELGIRIAIGAQPREVLQAALGPAFKLLAVGSAAGLLLGLLTSRVLALIVYQATPRDPVVLTGVILAMALVGLLATWIPARRALSLDPMVLLREE